MTSAEVRENAMQGLRQYQAETITALKAGNYVRVVECVHICKALASLAQEPSAVLRTNPEHL